MDDFIYRDDELFCEDLRVSDIAEKLGTPFYLYSKHTLVNHYKVLDEAFSGIPHLICYSVKANSNVALLKILANEGSGADIVSGGELFRALKSGIDPQKIVYAGVGKTAEEIEYALEQGILMFNVESSQEMRLVNDVAERMGKRAQVAIRVNPDIDPGTHPHIATGLRESKFGIPLNQAMAEYEVAKRLSAIDPVGIHQHIGSQILDPGPFEESIKKIAHLANSLKVLGFDIRYINIGGGFGIQYTDENAPSPDQLSNVIVPIISKSGCALILEIGRMIAGNAGILVTKVLYNKKTEDKQFIVVDAAMNDIMRPALYQAEHHITPLKKDTGAREVVVDVVGPICESVDFLARDRPMPEVEQGDLLALFTAGAYGFSMSSNYNSRLRVPEILVSGHKAYVIRRRETHEDLVHWEAIPKDFT